MNRMVMLLTLGLLSLCVFPSALNAQVKQESEQERKNQNCVPDTVCPEGEDPKKCCKPPPCEFWDALEQARAREIIIASNRLKIDPDEGTDEQFKAVMKSVNKEFKKIRKQHPKCPKKGSQRGKTPIFSVVPDFGECKISTQVGKTFQQLSLRDVLQTTKACDELVEARYEAAAVSEAYCAMGSTSPYDRAKEQYEKAQREKSLLEDQLMHYFRVCTIAEDSEVAQIVTSNTVDKLKKKATNKKWPKKKAERSTKTKKSG